MSWHCEQCKLDHEGLKLCPYCGKKLSPTDKERIKELEQEVAKLKSEVLSLKFNKICDCRYKCPVYKYTGMTVCSTPSITWGSSTINE